MEKKKNPGELSLPRWEEIPEMGLYMDQTLHYLNSCLKPLSLDGTNLLTSSMINNYVKNSIVKKPVGKLYKRYHLAFLIIVVLLKQCYSLGEIQEFIKIYSNIEDPDRIARDFNKAVSVFEQILNDVQETGQSRRVYFKKPSYEQKLMTLALHSVACKVAAQKLAKEKALITES